MLQPCLFIGGPADGEIRQVEPDHTCHVVAETFNPEPWNPATATFKKHVYERAPIVDKDGARYGVFLHESVREAPLRALMTGYRRPLPIDETKGPF